MERLLEDVWIAEAVHQDDADAMAAMCALKRRHIVEFDSEADHFQTAFAIALWPERKEVSSHVADRKETGWIGKELTAAGGTRL